MNEKVHALINQQINKEFYSAYLYLNFSNYFEEVGLDGFANWYKIQAQEERDHAMLFYQYLQNENQKVTFEAIDKPDLNAACHMDVLKAGLEHEKYVTSLINDIYSEAYEAKDFRTMQFLDWFVKEQGEEETNAKNLISKIELFGSDPKSLYIECLALRRIHADIRCLCRRDHGAGCHRKCRYHTHCDHGCFARISFLHVVTLIFLPGLCRTDFSSADVFGEAWARVLFGVAVPDALLPFSATSPHILRGSPVVLLL